MYHAVEHRNTLSLFFVSPSISSGSGSSPRRKASLRRCLIWTPGKADRAISSWTCLQGAFYRRDSRVYSGSWNRQKPGRGGWIRRTSKFIRRLNILKKQGLTSDLDVIDLVSAETGDLFSAGWKWFSAIRWRDSSLVAGGKYEKLIVQMKEAVFTDSLLRDGDEPGRVFVSWRFCFCSPDPDDWEEERDAQGDKEPYAVVLDF